MADNINPREIALDILIDIDKNNRLSNSAIQTALRKHQFSSKQDRAFITRICEGVTEYRLQLDYIINQFSNTKINKCKPLIRSALRMGVYQIKYMDSIPDTAACNETVKLVKKRGFSSLSGFVNGVLRNIARNIEDVKYPTEKANPAMYLSIKYSIPEWIVDKLVADYDYETAKTIIEASVTDKATTIRCCENNIDIDKFIAKLEGRGIDVTRGNYVDSALFIDNYDYIRKVPGFFDGEFVVQDESSMLVGLVASPSKDDLILDVCAAPGGKSLHIADLLGNKGRIIARDLTENKVELIKENIDRCNYTNVSCEEYDATVLDESMIEKADIVIADLPCSGLGIIGKKNDIKYRLSTAQLDELVALQRNILSIVSQYVKPGGTLVYSTCTINVDENINNAMWFRDNYDFEFDSIEEYLPESIDSDTKKDGYVALLQGKEKCDGFFIARFKKNSNK